MSDSWVMRKLLQGKAREFVLWANIMIKDDERIDLLLGANIGERGNQSCHFHSFIFFIKSSAMAFKLKMVIQ